MNSPNLAQTEIPVIGEAAHFYGFIIALSVQPGGDLDYHGPYTEMLASFENGNELTTWRVPDAELFQCLAGHLVGMALEREVTLGADYGYEKLWIRKRAGHWHVERS